MTQKCIKQDYVMEAMRHTLVMDAISQEHVAEIMRHQQVVEAMKHWYVLKAMRHKHVWFVYVCMWLHISASGCNM